MPSRAWLTFDATVAGKKNSPGVMSGDTSGKRGKGWYPEEASRLEGGVSVEGRGDIRTAGSTSRAGSCLAQAGTVPGSGWG